jgi:serine protease Do
VRGFLGIEIQAVTQALSEALGLKSAQGALVSKVLPGSPAEAAGLEPGDVILKFGLRPVFTLHDLLNKVASATPGKKVRIDALRNGKTLTLYAMPGKRGGAEAAPKAQKNNEEKTSEKYESKKLGVMVAAASRKNEDGAEEESVLVLESDWDPSAELNPRPGDFVLRINSKEIHSLKDFRKTEKGLQSGAYAVLMLLREGNAFFTSVKIN